MRVLKEGSLPEAEVFRATCPNCRTEFEFTRGEATYESSCRNDEFLKIACPKCRRIVYVEI